MKTLALGTQFDDMDDPADPVLAWYVSTGDGDFQADSISKFVETSESPKRMMLNGLFGTNVAY